VLKSTFHRPATRLYPAQRVPPPPRYRGRLYFVPQACTGCGLCVKDCPSKAIEMTIIDRAAKRYLLKYHMDRCVYCGQCMVSCKFKCIDLAREDWEHAALNKDEFTIFFGKAEDIEQSLAKSANGTAQVKQG
jgi:formate hydrogenlyase subunit 6/NADH:ubiquinone oxidoreductase subunit I